VKGRFLGWFGRFSVVRFGEAAVVALSGVGIGRVFKFGLVVRCRCEAFGGFGLRFGSVGVVRRVTDGSEVGVGFGSSVQVFGFVTAGRW